MGMEMDLVGAGGMDQSFRLTLKVLIFLPVAVTVIHKNMSYI